MSIIAGDAIGVIRGKLLEAVPELKEVYDSPPPAQAESALPFAVVRPVGGDGAGSVNSANSANSTDSAWKGLRLLNEVDLYVSAAVPEEMDRLGELVVNALDKQLLKADSGELWAGLYLGISGSEGDDLDEERGAVKRGMQIALLSPQPVSQPVQITGDSWLTALADWTKRTLGPEWAAFCGAWPPGHARPAMLWQMIGMDVRTLSPSSYEIEKRMTAFFRAENADQEHAGMLKLLEALGAAVKIPLDRAERTFLRIGEPKVSVPTAGLGTTAATGTAAAGPLTVSLIRRTAKPVEEAPLMQYVHYQSNMR
ncbi:hypothetical protein P4H42_10805 [Paenibacillus macerans]|uniref:hypothetical protein n=1 Tax=Paenibacillus macerans TaxID=44252 RepID=UPI002DB67074|nr:hypothetical protein [Paenibacillus macerans]MEC0330111.1 hypothetical protein [Paenibacillus macerans]